MNRMVGFVTVFVCSLLILACAGPLASVAVTGVSLDAAAATIWV